MAIEKYLDLPDDIYDELAIIVIRKNTPIVYTPKPPEEKQEGFFSGG